MTGQMCDFFEYQTNEYCLMGFTGGNLVTAQDFGMSFYPGSTADARGYCITYGIDSSSRLTVKRLEIRGEEINPTGHDYTPVEIDGQIYYILNKVVPLTGYVLFSDIWDFSFLYQYSPDDDREYKLFEVAVDQGFVKEVRECGAEVREKVRGRRTDELLFLWSGKMTVAEKLAQIQAVWDITANILPHRYDMLYMRVWYFSFIERIEELRKELQ